MHALSLPSPRFPGLPILTVALMCCRMSALPSTLQGQLSLFSLPAPWGSPCRNHPFWGTWPREAEDTDAGCGERGRGQGRVGAGVPRAHTPGLCSGFGSQAAGLAALGPAGHLLPRVAPELRNLGVVGNRGLFTSLRGAQETAAGWLAPSSPLDKQQQQHLKGEEVGRSPMLAGGI